MNIIQEKHLLQNFIKSLCIKILKTRIYNFKEVIENNGSNSPKIVKNFLILENF